MALLLWAAPLLLVPAAPELAVVMVLLAVAGAGNVLFDVTVVTLLQRAVPRHLIGRAFGALETVIVLGITLGALVAPALERLRGPDWAFAALGAPLALVALAGLRGLLRLDRDLRAPTRQVDLLRGLAPFALLPTLELEALALALQRQRRPVGEVVVRQGEPGRPSSSSTSGELAVAVDGRDVARLGPGESFGEIALLRGGLRTATLTVRTPAVLWALDGSRFVATLGAGDGRAIAAADGGRRPAAARRAAGPGRGPVVSEAAAPGAARRSGARRHRRTPTGSSSGCGGPTSRAHGRPGVLGVFAHPDDEVFCAGGTLARCAQAWAPWTAVVCSDPG